MTEHKAAARAALEAGLKEARAEVTRFRLALDSLDAAVQEAEPAPGGADKVRFTRKARTTGKRGKRAPRAISGAKRGHLAVVGKANKAAPEPGEDWLVRALKLRDEGHSMTSIAEEVGKPYHTVYAKLRTPRGGKAKVVKAAPVAKAARELTPANATDAGWMQ
jgi:hypothetical protein